MVLPNRFKHSILKHESKVTPHSNRYIMSCSTTPFAMHPTLEDPPPRAGNVNASVALDLSLYLRQETSYLPWHTALNHLFHWKEVLRWQLIGC